MTVLDSMPQMQLHKFENNLEHSSNAFALLLCPGQKVMNVRLNVVWRKTATVDQHWCPSSGICYTAGQKERLSSGDNVLFINSVIYFRCWHLNTLFYFKVKTFTPTAPNVRRAEVFNSSLWEPSKTLEVDRGSEEELRAFKCWEKLYFMQMRSTKCQPEVQVVSHSRCWSFIVLYYIRN